MVPPRCKGDDYITIVIDKKEHIVNLKQGNISSCGYGLAFQRWYWGNATRDMVATAMIGQPDGTFVIRDASTDGDFTLTLKVRGTDRLIKVICVNGKCGFNVESLEYDSVLHLMDAHRECPLTEYNPDLNVPLTFPLGRLICLGKKSSKLLIDDTYKRMYFALRCHMEGLQADYERIASQFDNLFWRKITLEQSIDARINKIYTCEEVTEIVAKNLQVMANKEQKCAAWVKDAYKRTMKRLNKHIKRYTAVKPLFDIDRGIFQAYLDLVDDALEAMENEVLHAYEVAQDWKQIIADHGGMNADEIEDIADDVGYLVSIEPIKMSDTLLEIALKWDPTCWMSIDSNKDHATNRIMSIADKMPDNSDGVFLIRPSASQDGFFVLSISMGGRVHNCLIEYRAQPPPGEYEAGFAFLETANYFPTLVDFVKFYSKFTLKEHNEMLDTTLKYPAFPGLNATDYVMKSWEAEYLRIWNIIRRDPRVRAGVICYISSIIFHCFCSSIFDLSTTIYYSFFCAAIFALLTGWRYYMFSLQSYFLGFVTFFSVYSVTHSLMDFPLCVNMYIMASFHYFEFFAIGISNPESLSQDSFLLNHSVAYWTAMFAGWGEYLLRNHFYPGTSAIIMFIGIMLCIAGEVFRKLAMWHAGTGFTHLVAFRKNKSHTLVTDGIYSICRHPAYLGFFLFSVGTQVLLSNYICSIAFAYYQKDVPIGLPFINGFTHQQ
uniref:Protein-S-isoprenylcysteine O-methyltransferase n=1 Tax=Panagrolaimus superbus TaxID=310955 RepID=A0A914YPM7_9BILA